MAKTISAKTLLTKNVRRTDRILLVNPPVEETRYNWVKWNQPVDLLKLGSYLRSTVECSVELLDCMKAGKDWAVPQEWLPINRRYRTVGEVRYPMRRFGLSYNEFKKRLENKKRAPKTAPTQIWITSLCSYWFEPVAETCRIAKDLFPDVQIVLIGQYARLMPEHAASACAADVIVKDSLSLENEIADFDLYGDAPPPFVAVGLNPAIAIEEISRAVNKQIYSVAFFADDILLEDGTLMAEIFRQTNQLHRHLRYHAICGVFPGRLNPRVAKCFVHKQFTEFHFEEDDQGSEFNIDAYKRANSYLLEAGMKVPDERRSGFVWIGKPGETLEQIVLRAFHVVQTCGGVILKPFSPTPGSVEQSAHSQYLSNIPLQLWSPHFFPFAEFNKIMHKEYHDLYRMAAFLNERVRNSSFDFLAGTLGAELIKSSIRREVWNIESTAARSIAD